MRLENLPLYGILKSTSTRDIEIYIAEVIDTRKFSKRALTLLIVMMMMKMVTISMMKMIYIHIIMFFLLFSCMISNS